MISLIKTDTIKNDENEKIITGEFRGLSTDTKPTTYNDSNVGNGSIYLEEDSGKIYFYDTEKGWIEFGGGIPTPTVYHTLSFGDFNVYDGSTKLEGTYPIVTGWLHCYDTSEQIDFENEELSSMSLPEGDYSFTISEASNGDNTYTIMETEPTDFSLFNDYTISEIKMYKENM